MYRVITAGLKKPIQWLNLFTKIKEKASPAVLLTCQRIYYLGLYKKIPMLTVSLDLSLHVFEVL